MVQHVPTLTHLLRNQQLQQVMDSRLVQKPQAIHQQPSVVALVVQADMLTKAHSQPEVAQAVTPTLHQDPDHQEQATHISVFKLVMLDFDDSLKI